MEENHRDMITGDDALGDLIKKTVPPTVFGPMVPLAEAMVTVVLRDTDMETEDLAVKEFQIPLLDWVDDDKKGLRASDFRDHHFKFTNFQRVAEPYLGFRVSFQDSEIGYVIPGGSSSDPFAYVRIVSEVTWQNGINQMRKNLGRDLGEMKFMIFHPKPITPKRRHLNPGFRAETPVVLPEEQKIAPARQSPVRSNSPLPKSAASTKTFDNSTQGTTSGEGVHATRTGVVGQTAVNITTLTALRDEPILPVRDNYESQEEFDRALREYEQKLLDFVQKQAWDLSLKEGHNLCTDRLWKGVVCKIFRCDHKQLGPYYTIVVAGSDRNLLPVQGHGVYFIFLKLNGVEGGCWLSHTMGIGKTTQTITVHIIQHRINGMWKEIEDHLDAHCVHSNTSDACKGKCPSNARMVETFGYDCPCCESSPTHFIKPRLGLTIYTVPTLLLPTWKHEWKMCAPKSWDGTRIKILKCHHTATVDDEQLEGTNEKLARGIDRTKCTTTKVPQVVGGAGTVTRQSFSPFCVEPRIENGLVVILTTPHSFDSQFANKLVIDKSWVEVPLRRPNPNTLQGWSQSKDNITHVVKYAGYVVGIYVKDESHAAKRKVAQNVSRLKADMKGIHWAQKFGIVLMTGTPLYSGPTDIVEQVVAMSRPEWEDDDILKDFTHAALKKLISRWETAKRKFKETQDSAPLEEITEELRPLCGKLMLYVTYENPFLGKYDLVIKPVMVKSQLDCVHEDKWKDRVDNLSTTMQDDFDARKEEWKDWDEQTHERLPLYNPARFYRQRICASFPALDTIKSHTGETLKLTESEFEEKVSSGQWIRGCGKKNPYHQNIDKILQSSGKRHGLEMVYEQFEDMLDVDENPARGIFASVYFASTAVMYHWLRDVKKVDKKDVVWIYVSLGNYELQRRLSQFLGDPDSDTEQYMPRYLVATTASFGVGITIDKGIFIALMEQDHRINVQEQALARIHRQGNNNKTVWGFVIVGNCRVEQDVLALAGVKTQFAQSARGIMKEAQEPQEPIAIED